MQSRRKISISQALSNIVLAPSPCQIYFSAAKTTLWSSFYALSLSFVVLDSQRPTKTLERSSLSLLQKPSIFRYWYLKRYNEQAHTTYTILLSSASSAIWYVFHLSPAAPHEFVEVAKFRFYTKKSIFRTFYLRKFSTNRYYYLVHLREDTKPSKTAYFSLSEST